MDIQTTLSIACLIIVMQLLVILKYDYKMNKKNKLPKYWCVKNDGSQLFKDTVSKYIDNINSRVFSYNSKDCYYGWMKRPSNIDMFACVDEDRLLDYNNPTVLTLQEFIELTTEQVEFKDDFDTTNEGERMYFCFKTGIITSGNKDRPTPGSKASKINNRNLFYYFKTKERCQAYLDSIHNKSKTTPVVPHWEESNEKLLTLTQIKSKLSKHYDKDDVEDIIQVLTK